MGDLSAANSTRSDLSEPPQVPESIRSGLSSKTAASSEDSRRIALMLIDAQIDFIHPSGALSVPGAVDDARRTADWIRANTGSITHIFASLDSHIPLQIFFPTWWEDGEGNQPEPYTAITSEHVKNGAWRPRFKPEWSIKYVKALRDQARKDLMIWPFHVLLGTPGHALTPILYEAIAFHSAARSAQPRFIIKGLIPQTEYYSILEPEIKVPGEPRGGLDEALLEQLLSFDAIYFAGQAKSHCVLETVASIVKRHGDDREVMEKLYLLEDCTSSVHHPEIDFDEMATEAFGRFAELGLQSVSSGDPVG